MPTFQHAIGQGRASCGWGSPLFRVKDEGDGRNDVRVAHARPIVAETRGSWPCGQMLPRRRDRVRAREGGDLWGAVAHSAYLPLARGRACRMPRSPIQGKFGL